MSLQAAAQRSLALWEQPPSTGGGPAFESLLRRCRLDYSPASLGRIDAFLDALRRARQPVEADFVADPAQRQLLYLLAFYAGELLGRALGSAPLWLHAAQAAALAPQQALPPQAWRRALCARFGHAHAGDATLFLPLDAICGRLFMPADTPVDAHGLVPATRPWWPATLGNAAQSLPPLPGRPWPPPLPALAGDDAPADPPPAPPPAAADTAPAVDSDSPEALGARAMRLLKGEGVARDPAQARALWERAAAQGHPESLNHLGTLVAKGVGGPADLRVAMDHYRSAAEKGLAAAQLNMARMHLQHDGLAPDLVAAERWLRLAAAQGSRSARQLIEELELDQPPTLVNTGFGELADSVLGWLRERTRG